MISNSYGRLRILGAASGPSPHGIIEMMHEIIHLGLSRDRLLDLARGRTQDQSKDRSNAGGYRFGRISANSIRLQARRADGAVRELLGGILRLVTAAKLRRLEREFRIHGPQHDWMRIDDDHFTEVDR
jgi:hypothetical protein